MLTDAGERQSKLTNPNLIYSGGKPHAKPNVRKPLLSKSSGMGAATNWYFLPEKEALVSANPKVYAVFCALLGERALLFEPERMGIKVRNTGDMPRVSAAFVRAR